MNMSPIETAIKLAGGQTSLARALKISPVAIHKWLKSGKAPAERVLAIEIATAGQVTRYQLRPDVFGPAPEDRVA